MSSECRGRTEAGGPFFDDLTVGDVVTDAPSLTLTAGHAAVHQAIVGDRLPLHLDEALAARVVPGASRALAHPALVWDVAIGQSTLLTQRVIANLFYRGLFLRRMPQIGDTLRTTTEVVALRQNAPRPRREPTGLVALRVNTRDQYDRLVLDFWRCAMLPLRDPEGRTGHADDFAQIPYELDEAAISAVVAGWNRDESRVPVEVEIAVQGGDVVSDAPELARLTLNVARAHRDERDSGRRLVYGGHTIGIAAAQASLALPQLLTIIAWHSCEHPAPVFESDTLTSTVVIERMTPLAAGGALLHVRSRVTAHRARESQLVLDWRFVGVT